MGIRTGEFNGWLRDGLNDILKYFTSGGILKRTKASEKVLVQQLTLIDDRGLFISDSGTGQDRSRGFARSIIPPLFTATGILKKAKQTEIFKAVYMKVYQGKKTRPDKTAMYGRIYTELCFTELSLGLEFKHKNIADGVTVLKSRILFTTEEPLWEEFGNGYIYSKG